MAMNSITYRIAGLMFLTVAFTVFVLVYLANWQMTVHFKDYLGMQQMTISQMTGMPHGGMGSAEESFLTSVHQSLLWVGLGILSLGLAASYALGRSITVPLQRLSRAAEQIEQGHLEQKVPVETKDEIGHLAEIFNSMADTLATNQQLRKQLLANVAHELRTPLAIIQGHLEGMLDEVIDTNKEQLTSLHEEAVRLNRLITDLRDLSLAEAGVLTLEKGPTDLDQLIKRACHLLQPLAEEKRIELQYSISGMVPLVIADADRISQVLYNLVTNAIRYSGEETRIGIRVHTAESQGRRWIEVSIQDQGAGIAAADLPYVFDHFYRAEKSRNRQSGGSGLGLAVVKQVVELHGGQVAVDSEPGKGSCFTVRLPIEETEAKA